MSNDGKDKIKSNIYFQYRSKSGLTRQKASDIMETVSKDRLDKIERLGIPPLPYDIVQMAACYKAPELCNYYCTHECEIAKGHTPIVETDELSKIILGTLNSLNEIIPQTNRLIQISMDGEISDDEIPDFAYISKKLEEISISIASLNLWVEKQIINNNLNKELLYQEKESINK